VTNLILTREYKWAEYVMTYKTNLYSPYIQVWVPVWLVWVQLLWFNFLYTICSWTTG